MSLSGYTHPARRPRRTCVSRLSLCSCCASSSRACSCAWCCSLAPLQPPHPLLQRSQLQAQSLPGVLGGGSRAQPYGSRRNDQGSEDRGGPGLEVSGCWSQHHQVSWARFRDGWAQGQGRGLLRRQRRTWLLIASGTLLPLEDKAWARGWGTSSWYSRGIFSGGDGRGWVRLQGKLPSDQSLGKNSQEGRAEGQAPGGTSLRRRGLGIRLPGGEGRCGGGVSLQQWNLLVLTLAGGDSEKMEGTESGRRQRTPQRHWKQEGVKCSLHRCWWQLGTQCSQPMCRSQACSRGPSFSGNLPGWPHD